MEISSSKLVEIPRAEWYSLRDLYKVDWPKNLVGFYTVDNFIKWTEKDPNIKNLKAFSLDGDYTDGTFLFVDRYQLFLNTLNGSNDRLKRALSLLDWSTGYKVSSFLERHRQAVLDVVHEKQLELEYDSQTPLFYLPKEKAQQFVVEPPSNIYLAPMSPKDAKLTDDLWPNKHEGSLFFLTRLINWNPNIGAYKKTTNDLVAWCFRLQAGPLGALQVLPSEYRNGLGSLVTKQMCKQLAEIGHDTFAFVNAANIPSKSMFEKLGFVHLDTGYWLRTFPTFDFHWVD